jgi:nicotinamidase-related amidase
MATAVCVVDMLNPYDHEDADRLTVNVEQAVEPIASLVKRAGDVGVQIIYINDNYGDWNSSQEELAERAMSGSSTCSRRRRSTTSCWPAR